MDSADEIETRLSGDAAETTRRVELLRALVEAFDKEGEDAVAAVLTGRMNAVKQQFDAAMKQLNDKL